METSNRSLNNFIAEPLPAQNLLRRGEASWLLLHLLRGGFTDGEWKVSKVDARLMVD